MNDLATEKDNSPIQQFRDKVADRIRSDIGDLMPDEMLQQIVEQSIQQELMRPAPGAKSWETSTWLHEEIKAALDGKIAAMVQKEIAKQEKLIAAAVKEAVVDAVPSAITRIIMDMIKGQSMNISYEIQSMLNR